VPNEGLREKNTKEARKKTTRMRGGVFFVRSITPGRRYKGVQGGQKKIPGVFGIFGGQKKMLGNFPRSAAVPLSNQR